LVDQGLVVGARGADLGALPAGTPLFNHVFYNTFSLYATDSWKVTPTITVNYGVNWSVEVPPTDDTGKQALSLTLPYGKILVREGYLAARKQAALSGNIYNPTVGFAPISSTKRDYPYDLVLNTVAPRVAVAWNPKFGGGKTVLRAGYGQLF